MVRPLLKTPFLAVAVVCLTCLACGAARTGEAEEPSEYQQESSNVELAEQYMGEAGLSLSQDDRQGALANYLEAARLYDVDGAVTVERAEAHFLAASLAYELGEKEQAVEEYDKAVKIYLRFSGNSKIKAANALNNMGTIYKELQNKAKAQSCWEQALQIYKSAPPKLQNKSNMAMIEQNIRDLYEGY